MQRDFHPGAYCSATSGPEVSPGLPHSRQPPTCSDHHLLPPEVHTGRKLELEVERRRFLKLRYGI